MAKVRYQTLKNIKLKSDGYVHANHLFDTSFTFCAYALSNDGEEYEETTEKINCPQCIKWIDYCKSFKETGINRKNIQ